jgi:hypothetical protein
MTSNYVKHELAYAAAERKSAAEHIAELRATALNPTVDLEQRLAAAMKIDAYSFRRRENAREQLDMRAPIGRPPKGEPKAEPPKPNPMGNKVGRRALALLDGLYDKPGPVTGKMAAIERPDRLGALYKKCIVCQRIIADVRLRSLTCSAACTRRLRFRQRRRRAPVPPRASLGTTALLSEGRHG